MRQLLWALAGLLYATGVQAAVTVTWQANTEADLNGYAVQYASTCDGPWIELATTGRTPTFTDTAHDDGAYRVAAFDTTGHKSAFTSCQQVSFPQAIVTTVTPSATGATVRWTGTATRLRYASDDTRGYTEVTGILPTQGLYVHLRTWNRTQSWVCYQVEDAATGNWTEQGCNNFSGVEWETAPEPAPDPTPESIPSPFTVTITGDIITIEYAAAACPRGLNRATTGTQKRTLTLTCKK
jgi:hypothetical protein